MHSKEILTHTFNQVVAPKLDHGMVGKFEVNIQDDKMKTLNQIIMGIKYVATLKKPRLAGVQNLCGKY